MTWFWWAPFAAVLLHVIEEFVFPGGFMEWDRAYRPGIRDSITPRLHVVVNAALVLLCLQVGVLGGSSDAEARSVGAAVWLGVAALLLSNAVFHVVGTVRTGTRSPGVVTAVALYVPLAAAGYWRFLHGGEASPAVAAVAAAVGGSYHWWAALLHRARARGREAAGPRPRAR
jgi:hypothetical protein